MAAAKKSGSKMTKAAKLSSTPPSSIKLSGSKLRAEDRKKNGGVARRDLLILNKEIVACEACERLTQHCREIAQVKRKAYREHCYWGKPVPNFISPEAGSQRDLLIVGLAPGAHGANRTGRMFTGDRSGEWLYRALHKAGWATQTHSESLTDGMQLVNCVITAVCHCAPPGNKPTVAEIAACQPFLIETLRLSQPRIILALGKLAWDASIRQIKSNPQVRKLFALDSSKASMETLSPETREPETAAKGAPAMDASVSVPEALGGSRTIQQRPPSFAHGVIWKFSPICSLVGSYHPSQQNTFTGKLTESMLDQVFIDIAAQLKRG